jgi:hypothetical protein
MLFGNLKLRPIRGLNFDRDSRAGFRRVGICGGARGQSAVAAEGRSEEHEASLWFGAVASKLRGLAVVIPKHSTTPLTALRLALRLADFLTSIDSLHWAISSSVGGRPGFFSRRSRSSHFFAMSIRCHRRIVSCVNNVRLPAIPRLRIFPLTARRQRSPSPI